MRDFQENEIRLLRELRHELTAASVIFHAFRLQMLVRKANFNPNQPRVPRGNPDGGQWTKPGSGSTPRESFSGPDEQSPLIRISHDGPPEIPEKKPPTTPERNRVAVAVARYWRRTASGQLFEVLARTEWLLDHAGHSIRAYMDEPRSLEDLHRAVGEPKKGYNIHHIVEQTSARQDGFPNSMIHGRENLVRIPTFKHWEITAWYGRKNPRYGNLAPRDYLRGRNWEERTRIGLEALVDAEVLRP